MTDLERAKAELEKEGITCALCKGNIIKSFTERGVKPLIICYKQGVSYSQYSCADKVVGKATAFLYVLLQVAKVYAKVISKSALKLLQDNNIAVEYDELVENIINRTGDGICPFEYAVLHLEDKFIALDTILKKMKSLGIKDK